MTLGFASINYAGKARQSLTQWLAFGDFFLVSLGPFSTQPLFGGLTALVSMGLTLGYGISYHADPSVLHCLVNSAIVMSISLGGSAGFILHRAWTIRNKEDEDQKAVNAARQGLERQYTRL